MDYKQINDFKFYFKTESVVMEYHNQYTCFHTFNINDKKQINQFAERIQGSDEMDFNMVYNLARQHKLSAMATTKPSIEIIGNIGF